MDTRDATEIRKRVAQQYEKFPYPHSGLLRYFAKPPREQAHTLAYEFGQYLRTGNSVHHSKDTRILVAGSGTFEPIVAAHAHPFAQITAVDISEPSLRKLRKHAFFNRISSRIRTVRADLHENHAQTLGQFDYIICTGVLHHSPDPKQMLAGLTALLKPSGVLRLMVYPQKSRLWISALRDYFRYTTSTPDTCQKEIEKLVSDHPFRNSFRMYSDTASAEGLVDGFFHAWDEAPSIPELQKMSGELGLKLIGFGHAWHSQPGAFQMALKEKLASEEILNRYNLFTSWEKLSILDDLCELTVNPVYWLALNPTPARIGVPEKLELNPVLQKSIGKQIPGPLIPTKETELVARRKIPNLEKAHLAGKELEELVIGGWILGKDCALPSALSANRALRTTPTRIEACTLDCSLTQEIQRKLWSFLYTLNEGAIILTRENFGAQSWFEHSGTFLVPSPLRWQQLQGIRGTLEKLAPTSDEQKRLLKILTAVLEERIDLNGKELPWLSSGDLLRDLQARGLEVEQILNVIATYPTPPSEAQWVEAFGENPAKKILSRISQYAGVQWFIPVQKSL